VPVVPNSERGRVCALNKRHVREVRHTPNARARLRGMAPLTPCTASKGQQVRANIIPASRPQRR
jgi:hypothetical protein